MAASSRRNPQMALLVMFFALVAASLAALICGRQARARGSEVTRLRVQLTTAKAEVARLNGLVQQAESESGHPIYSDQ